MRADTWAIADDWAGYPTSGNGTAQCRLNRWAAIETDQRFPAVLAELVKHGFKPGDQTKPGWLGLAMRNTRDQVDKGTFFLYRKFKLVSLKRFCPIQHLDRNRRVWNAVNVVRAVEYLEVAFFGPAKKHYPDVKCSDMGYTSKSVQVQPLPCVFFSKPQRTAAQNGRRTTACPT